MDDGLGIPVHPQAVTVLGQTTSLSAMWFAGRVHNIQTALPITAKPTQNHRPISAERSAPQSTRATSFKSSLLEDDDPMRTQANIYIKRETGVEGTCQATPGLTA
jgi:hypothetical protein